MKERCYYHAQGDEIEAFRNLIRTWDREGRGCRIQAQKSSPPFPSKMLRISFCLLYKIITMISHSPLHSYNQDKI